jgi:hypothetical protein
MANYEPKDYVQFIGIVSVLFVGLINIVITITQHKKSSFINSVSQERFRFIHELRNSIAEFCALNRSNPLNLQEILKVQYRILLSLNPEYKEWDGEIITLLKKIVDSTQSNDRDKNIEELVLISQFLIKLEWDGVNLEATKGILNEVSKESLRTRVHSKYKSVQKLTR